MDWLKYAVIGGLMIAVVAIMGDKFSAETIQMLIAGASVVGIIYAVTHSPIGHALAERIKNRPFQTPTAPILSSSKASDEFGKMIITEIKDALISKFDQSLSKKEKKLIQSDFPQGIIAIMFTDMENFTGLIERGDEEANRLLKRHNQVISEAAKQWSGHVVKGYGDGFMVAFPSARRAVYSAISIQQIFDKQNASLPQDDQIWVRIGIDAGEPIKEGDDYIGRAVNRAARIASLADGRQIYVSDTVQQLVGPVQNLQYIDLGEQSLKGFKEKHQVFEISRIEALSHPLDSEIDKGIAELEKRVSASP